jgi:hypothetical protein
MVDPANALTEEELTFYQAKSKALSMSLNLGGILS